MSDRLTELKKLYVQEKEYKIPIKPKEGQTQATIKLMPLSLEDMGLLDISDDTSIRDQVKMLLKVISKCLGVEEESLHKISAEYMADLMECVKEANNLGDAGSLIGSTKAKGLLEKYTARGSSKSPQE